EPRRQGRERGWRRTPRRPGDRGGSHTVASPSAFDGEGRAGWPAERANPRSSGAAWPEAGRMRRRAGQPSHRSRWARDGLESSVTVRPWPACGERFRDIRLSGWPDCSTIAPQKGAHRIAGRRTFARQPDSRAPRPDIQTYTEEDRTWPFVTPG